MRHRLAHLLAVLAILPPVAMAGDDEGKSALLEGVSGIRVRVFVRDYASPPADPGPFEEELKQHVERALAAGGVPISQSEEPPQAILQVNVDSKRVADECLLTVGLQVLEWAYLIRNGQPTLARTWGLPRATTVCSPVTGTAPGLIDRLLPRFIADFRSSHPDVREEDSAGAGQSAPPDAPKDARR